MDKFNIILEKLLNERLPTSQIDPTKFPNPFKGDPDKFLTKGKRDGRESDDKIEAKRISLSVKQLKPSQDAIYLSKALSMAVSGIAGGDLDAVISADNYILDGHHRYASTMFNNPSADVSGLQVDLEIGDLIPVLRAVGDALRNKRGTAPKSGGTSVFNATIEDVKEAIYEGKDMNPRFYDREKAIAWFENLGEEVIETRLGMIKKKLPPSGAPQRKNMPRIHPKQLNYLMKIMQGGKVDVVEPYANENKMNKKIHKLKDLLKESDYITWSTKPPARRMPDETPPIFKGRIAKLIARELKKAIQKYNEEMEPYSEFYVPIVNYPQSTREGYLILGVVRTDKPGVEKDMDEWKQTQDIEERAEQEFMSILKQSNSPVESMYHRGIHGPIPNSNKRFKSGIVYSITTAGRVFNEETEKELKEILGLL